MKHRMSKKDRAGASRSGQPVPMSVTGLATSPFVPHTYSLGHERAKANGEFEKLLPPAASLAVGDIDHGGIATATWSVARRRLSLLPDRGARLCRPSYRSSPPEQMWNVPEFPDSPRHYPLWPPFSKEWHGTN